MVLCSIWFNVLCVPSVLWHCRLGHLTRKNPSPYDLYCVGGTLSLTQSINQPLCQSPDHHTTIRLAGNNLAEFHRTAASSSVHAAGFDWETSGSWTSWISSSRRSRLQFCCTALPSGGSCTLFSSVATSGLETDWRRRSRRRSSGRTADRSHSFPAHFRPWTLQQYTQCMQLSITK